jgi:predicted phosphoribosyltransferase
MVFVDREDAARQLCAALKIYQHDQPLVLAIPRGGVPLGRVLADTLHGELDVVLVRKVGAPGNPEFAVGSVGESGKVFVADYAERTGADASYLAEEVGRQLGTIQRRRLQYAVVRLPVAIHGRTVIVVDDGMATGATMRSALLEVRSQNPAKLICAVPVSSPEAVAVIRPFCDALVCLQVVAEFGGVGRFYTDFKQVDDEEVVATLAVQA